MLQKCLNTEVCESRSEEYRGKLSGTYKLLIKLIAGSVEKLDIVAQLCVEIGTDDGIHVCSLHVEGLCGNLLLSAHGSREGCDLLCLAVIYTLEALTAADRPVDRTCMDSENLLDLAHELERVSRLAVHLVYEGKNRDMAHHTDLEQFDGLRLDTFGSVDNHDGGVRCH